MKKLLWFLIYPLISLPFISSPRADVPQARLEQLTKGINIPHWYWSRQAGTLIDHYINPKDIQILKSLGVKHVRIPFDMGDLDKPDIIQHLKASIQGFVDQRIAVIVSAFGDMYNREVITTSRAQALLEKLCQEVIRPTSPDYVFVQIANEPWVEEPEIWSKIQNTLIQTARKILPNHTLVTSTPLKFGKGEADWNMFIAFARMTPSDDTNVIYSFHFYEPFLFTHQGAKWDPNAKFVKNWHYPSTKQNSEEVIKALDKKAPAWISDQIGKTWAKVELKKNLDPIIEWRSRYKRPIMVTEFGVYRKGTDEKSRVTWISDVVSIFSDAKLPWTYWDYAGGFGLFYEKDALRALDRQAAVSLGFSTPN